MRHSYFGRQLSRTTNERKQLFRNLTKAFIIKGEMVTTLAKAKAVQRDIEKLITLAKNGSFTGFRHLVSFCGDQKTAEKYKNLGQVFISRAGGYTRIIKLGSRSGDNAPLVKLELVEKLTEAAIVNTGEQTKVKSKVAKSIKKLPKAKTKTTSKSIK